MKKCACVGDYCEQFHSNFIYRSPTGDFNYFLNQLESILNITYKTSTTTSIILCGDINIRGLLKKYRTLIFPA